MKRLFWAAACSLALCSGCDGWPHLQNGQQTQPSQPQAQQQQPPGQCAIATESDACRTLASNRLALYDKPDTYPMSEKERHDAYVSLYTECMNGHDWQANAGSLTKRADASQQSQSYAALSPSAGANAANEYPTGSTVIQNTQNMPPGSSTSSYTSPNGSTVVVVQGTQAAPAGPAVIYASPYGVQSGGGHHKHDDEQSSDENYDESSSSNNTRSRVPTAQAIVNMGGGSQGTRVGNVAQASPNAPMAQTIVTFPDQSPPSAAAPAPAAPLPPAPMSQTVIIRAPQIGQGGGSTSAPALTAAAPMSQTVVIPPPQIEATMAPPVPPPAPMAQTVVIPPPQQAPQVQAPVSQGAPMSQTVVIPPQQQAPQAQATAPEAAPMAQTVVIPPQQMAPQAQAPATEAAPMAQTVVIPQQPAQQAQAPEREASPMAQTVVVPQQPAPQAQAAPAAVPMAQTVVVPPASAGAQNSSDYYAPHLSDYAPAAGSPSQAPDTSGSEQLEQILTKPD